ncbi:hypothetical protein EMMF5_003324 [Cystobasidiomycetes sp. EMM_F5]
MLMQSNPWLVSAGIARTSSLAGSALASTIAVGSDTFKPLSEISNTNTATGTLTGATGGKLNVASSSSSTSSTSVVLSGTAVASGAANSSATGLSASSTAATTTASSLNTGPALASPLPINGYTLSSHWSSLSNTCKAQLQLIVNKSEFGTCSGISKLYSDLVSNAAVDASTNLVPMVKDWLDGYACKPKPCESSVVNKALQDVSAACKTDMDNKNWIATAVNGGMLNFETLREAGCQKDTKTDEFCPVEVLNSISSTGIPITWANAQKIMPDPLPPLQAIPKSSYCTSCGHALATGLLKSLSLVDTNMHDQVKNWVEKQCGTAFGDEEYPSDLVDGSKPTVAASSAAATGSSTASSGGDGSGGFDSGSAKAMDRSLITTAGLLLGTVILFLAM